MPLSSFELYASHIGLRFGNVSALPDPSVKIHLFLLLSLSDPIDVPKFTEKIIFYYRVLL
jgi:hypothetical protein